MTLLPRELRTKKVIRTLESRRNTSRAVLSVEPKHVWWVVGVALVVRLGFLAWGLSDVPMTPPSTQADSYLMLGYGVAGGYGYIEPDAGSPVEALVERLRVAVEDDGQRLTHLHAGPLPAEGWIPRTLHPPGMALVVAGLHKLTGGRVGFLLQVLGGLLDVATAVLVLLLVRSLWSNGLGLATGLAYAAFPPAAFSSISRGSECFLAFFVVGTVYALLRGVRSPGNTAWSWYALAGVLTGLGTLLRPDYLFLPLFMIPAVAWMGRSWRHAIAALVLAQAVAVLCLVPWGARNKEAVGRWVLTSTSVGATLITSLGEFHNPWNYGYTDGSRAEMAQQVGIDSPWSSAADVYFRDLYAKSILEHPAAMVSMVARRAPLALLAPYEFGYVNTRKTASFTDLRLKEGLDRYDVLLKRPFYLLAAYWERLVVMASSALCLLAAALMLWRERERRGAVWFLLSAHVYTLGTHMLIHIDPRFLIASVFAWLAPLMWLSLVVARKRLPAPTEAPALA